MDSEITLLIGLPASGKSTFRNKFIENNPDTIVISNDDCLEELGKKKNLSYNQAFFDKEIMKESKSILKNRFEEAIRNSDNIFIDMTNLTKKTRNKFISQIDRKIYFVRYIVFDIPRDVINKNHDERFLATGKKIPSHVIDDMMESFEYPLSDEYDELIVIDENYNHPYYKDAQ